MLLNSSRFSYQCCLASKVPSGTLFLNLSLLLFFLFFSFGFFSLSLFIYPFCYLPLLFFSFFLVFFFCSPLFLKKYSFMFFFPFFFLPFFFFFFFGFKSTFGDATQLRVQVAGPLVLVEHAIDLCYRPSTRIVQLAFFFVCLFFDFIYFLFYFIFCAFFMSQAFHANVSACV